MENDANKTMICADCGKEYDASASCCPECGLPASGVMPKVKMTEISKIANPYWGRYREVQDRSEINHDNGAGIAEFFDEVADSADAGDLMAKYFLATEVFKGEKHQRRAYELLKEASDAGSSMAENELGSMYCRGAYVAKDFGAATRYFRRAAMRGDPVAMRNLGDRYLFGEGVRHDTAKAIACFEQSYASGWWRAARDLSDVYSSPDYDCVDYAKAVMYARFAANAGDAESKYRMYEFYMNGQGVERDPGGALVWCLQAAEEFYVPAMETMALFYERGVVVKADYSEAFKWYEKAATGGSNWAKLQLAVYHNLGIVGEENPSRAYYLAMSALDSGYNEALWQVSYHFRTGRGVRQDTAKADEYLRRALNEGTQFAWRGCNPESARRELEIRMRWAGGNKDRLSKIANWLERSDCPDEAREIRSKHPEITEVRPEEHRKHVTPCLWRKDSTPSAALVSDCFKFIRRMIAVILGVFLIALAKQLFVL